MSTNDPRCSTMSTNVYIILGSQNVPNFQQMSKMSENVHKYLRGPQITKMSKNGMIYNLKSFLRAQFSLRIFPLQNQKELLKWKKFWSMEYVSLEATQQMRIRGLGWFTLQFRVSFGIRQNKNVKQEHRRRATVFVTRLVCLCRPLSVCSNLALRQLSLDRLI